MYSVEASPIKTFDFAILSGATKKEEICFKTGSIFQQIYKGQDLGYQYNKLFICLLHGLNLSNSKSFKNCERCDCVDSGVQCR